MTTTETMLDRNATFARERFAPGLRMMPSLRTIVIGCVDPRVDPTDLLGALPGEVAAIRNVGGRVTPGVVEELVMLRAVTPAAGGDLGPGWQLVVLQHTDCGITRLTERAGMLAAFLGVEEAELDSRAVPDPHAAVALDVAVLAAETRLVGVHLTGLVYDVTTGLVEVVTDAGDNPVPR